MKMKKDLKEKKHKKDRDHAKRDHAKHDHARKAKESKKIKSSLPLELDHPIIGIYEDNKTFGFVQPDQYRNIPDVVIAKEDSLGALSGQRVLVEITKFFQGKKSPEGKILEIIGDGEDPGLVVTGILRERDVQTKFKGKAKQQAKDYGKTVAPEDLEGREDLTEELMVTIDGEDARDFDDAVSLAKEDGLYVLGVHIADVSHYVPAGTPLDKAAIKRGTSIYLPDRVIPMLPKSLSNGLCSLVEGEKRLTLTCRMWIDEEGEVKKHTLTESVIVSKARMTYSSVEKIITDRDEDERKKYERFVPMLDEMARLAQVLKKKRARRGALDFDTVETKVTVDENGFPSEVVREERGAANRLIEEFMIVANETVAERFAEKKAPFVYRIHEAPDEEKLENLREVLHHYRVEFPAKGGKIKSKDVQAILKSTEEDPKGSLLHRATLRSMMHAAYDEKNKGHFGLAAKSYCHFTSPIRRYPDLQIHRIIRDDIRGSLSDEKKQIYKYLLPAAVEASNARERVAEEVERAVVKREVSLYMTKHIGDVYEGVISGISDWGFYVELASGIEGLVHVMTLTDDYYLVDEKSQTLIGERRGKTYALGESVRVEVINAEPRYSTIDFRLCED